MDRQPLAPGRHRLRVFALTKHLNFDVPAFTDGKTLHAGVVLERVRIMEVPSLYADYTGLG